QAKGANAHSLPRFPARLDDLGAIEGDPIGAARVLDDDDAVLHVDLGMQPRHVGVGQLYVDAGLSAHRGALAFTEMDTTRARRIGGALAGPLHLDAHRDPPSSRGTAEILTSTRPCSQDQKGARRSTNPQRSFDRSTTESGRVPRLRRRRSSPLARILTWSR